MEDWLLPAWLNFPHGPERYTETPLKALEDEVPLDACPPA